MPEHAASDLPEAVIELLYRHHLDAIEPRSAARLREIFRHNPPDAIERLTTAANYLKLNRLTPLTQRRIDHAIATQATPTTPPHTE